MPVYEYECKEGHYHEKTLSLEHFQPSTSCPTCGDVAQRVITKAPNINTSNCQFDSHFNYGLGKVVHSNREVKESLRKMNGETGRDFQEVGTDNLSSIKKSYKRYDKD